MEFAEVVRKRRMVRNFAPESVPMEQIERLLDLARRAPSAGYTQGQRFVVVTRPELRAKVAEACGEAWYVEHGHHPFVSGAPVNVVLCTSEEAYRARYREPDKRAEQDEEGGEEEDVWPIPWWHVDAGMAAMVLLLGAVDAGLAAGLVGVQDEEGLKALLGIPADVTPVAVIPIGHPAPDVPSPSLKRGRRPVAEVVHWEGW